MAYRNHDLVREVLRQLDGQSLPPRKVLIADNGGTLSAADLTEMPLADRTELVSLPENPGYGAAVNVARDRLGHDALLVLTHDAVFGPGLAERLLDTLKQGAPTAGCAAPLLRFADNRERVFSAGGLVTAGGRASHLNEPRAAKPYPVAWVDGAIAMYTAAALEAIDWIAEEYFLYFEDVDTGWRLSQHGFESLIVPDEISYQQPGAHPMYLGIRNMVLFARKSGIPRAKNRAAVIRRVARESLGRLRRGKPSGIGEAIRGWRDGNRGLSGKP
ncbi:glycosyltransferase family 2 protein [Leucobacter sp. UT-8R-CII-1-4]|nr:glycosyltransferase family 2 protein [Leucobacter sp. UT-8R-CII-1-4]MDI6023737.1 glycosyltransferase family 2 protein [Leucobacter sp. UT-8R-CII-1-4]